MGLVTSQRRRAHTHTPHLALDERPQEHEDGDTSPHDEIEEVPQGQAPDLPQSHLLHLEAQPVPLASELPLKADENHLQCFTPGKEKSESADLAIRGTLPTSSGPHPQPFSASDNFLNSETLSPCFQKLQGTSE